MIIDVKWLKIKKNFVLRKIGFISFLIPLGVQPSSLFTINPIGAQILEYLFIGKSFDWIVSKFSREFSISKPTIIKDVNNFFDEITTKNLNAIKSEKIIKSNYFKNSQHRISAVPVKKYLSVLPAL